MEDETCEQGKIEVDGVEYSMQCVAFELCSAFEGGTSWAEIVDRYDPIGAEKGRGKDWFYLWQRPMLPGGSVTLMADGDERRYLLNLDAIKDGIKFLINESSPMYHCGGVINWQDQLLSPAKHRGDGCTGDMFLQACLFGEVIYG